MQTTGLRERNRVRRSRRMERAAIELALEHGVDHVTVEQICEAADVSPRTLFNYFGSKEGALLGPAPAQPEQAAVDAFLTGTGTVLEDLMAMLAATFLATDPDMELFALRRELFAQEPALHAAQLARVADKRERVADLIVERLRAADPGLADEAARAEAHLTHGIAMTAFQQLGREWITAGGPTTDIPTLVSAGIDSIRRIVSPPA